MVFERFLHHHLQCLSGGGTALASPDQPAIDQIILDVDDFQVATILLEEWPNVVFDGRFDSFAELVRRHSVNPAYVLSGDNVITLKSYKKTFTVIAVELAIIYNKG